MMLRIKDYTTKVGSGVTPRGGAETYLDEGIPLFRSQNVTNDGFLMDDIAFISEEVDESMKGTRVKPGDVLLNITGASIGRCYYTADDFKRGNVNQHVCIIRPKKNKVKSEYLHYYIISDIGQQQIDLTQTGANREGLAIEDIKGFTFDIPSLSEQQHIVDYLDENLAKINSQIKVLEKQQDAYARLKKSVTHQAVTRGLNPNVPLKDSGIEWMGMIPEHWEVKRFKEFASTTKGKQCDYYDSLGNNMAVVLTVETLRHDVPTFYNYGILDDKKQLCNETDIVVIWDGAGVGEFLKAKKGMLSSTIARIDVNAHKVLKRYLWQWRYNIEYRLKQVPTGMGIPHLSLNLLNNYLIPIPPFSEQQAIANYLDEKCAKIDAAVENIGKQIDASKRLKRALINEVITGQRAV